MVSFNFFHCCIIINWRTVSHHITLWKSWSSKYHKIIFLDHGTTILSLLSHFDFASASSYCHLIPNTHSSLVNLNFCDFSVIFRCILAEMINWLSHNMIHESMNLLILLGDNNKTVMNVFFRWIHLFVTATGFEPPNNLVVSLAKWLSVRLRTKWLWVRISLLSPRCQTWRLFRARSFLTFRQQ